MSHTFASPLDYSPVFNMIRAARRTAKIHLEMRHQGLEYVGPLAALQNIETYLSEAEENLEKITLTKENSCD